VSFILGEEPLRSYPVNNPSGLRIINPQMPIEPARGDERERGMEGGAVQRTGGTFVSANNITYTEQKIRLDCQNV